MDKQSTQITKARFEKLGKQVVKALKSRHFDAVYVETAPEAVKAAMAWIPDASTVSWGGSLTLAECGMIEAVYARAGLKVIDRDKAETAQERNELMRSAFFCDVYLTSFNAISEDGVLFNVDGGGNRVAAIAFGPKSVIAIIGINKVVKTREDAYQRARQYAAPINTTRLELKGTGCAKTGSCSDCKAEDSICTYVMETRLGRGERIKIILVGESFGF